VEKSAFLDYLGELNAEQREAVHHAGKPLLILAGAGSGKTRVITTKIAYFIREKGVKPWSILAVTFTNKAAKEMAQRAAQIEERAAGSMIRTFHSFGAWFLRRNAEAAGLSPHFTIYDDTDAAALLGAVVDKKKDELRVLCHQISRAKDRNLGPDSDDLPLINHRAEFRAIYKKYEERLRQTGNVDFGDLIKKPVEVLRASPEIAERSRHRFRVIMVDEYQDANVAQFELLRELWREDGYLCVVGDDDQSIYRFRGAEVRNILDFPTLFGGADIIKLEKNYRSTGEILELAHSVVSHNTGRHGKKLSAARGSGKKPRLVCLENQDDEASFAADLITRSAAARHGAKTAARYADWAILYRTNAQSAGFESELVRRRIPYKIVGSLKFYEREEVKDALALLSFMVNPRDEVSFRRIINKPARGLGPAAVERILDERWNEQDWNIEETLKRLLPSFGPKARGGAEAFLAALEAGRSGLNGDAVFRKKGRDEAPLKSGEGLSVCVERLVSESGIAAYHEKHDELSGEQRLANLQELINNAVLYSAGRDGLSEFLEHIELDRSFEKDEEGDDRVTLITLHNTKGLEFRRVIMTGLEQGIFPRSDKKDEDLEEERRLFYVGATRAMDELYLTVCEVRRMWGRISYMEPSLFLRELDSAYLEGAPSRGAAAFLGGGRSSAYNGAFARQNAPRGGSRKTSSDGRWTEGDRVFNDDYGYGEIQSIKETEDGPVVSVFFENGKPVRFLSAVQSKNYLKIGRE
jgi:DNA helicase-2/ATP-dependent DNA helicase PcrA